MLEIKHLDHILITIPTGTSKDARKFYLEILQLNEIHGNHPHGAIWIKLGNIELHIREEEGHQRNSARHAAFVVKNLKTAKDFLIHNNVEISYSSAIKGRDRCFFRDPWGNRLELIEFIS
ncbi:VOC family protein [Algoriphagus winogradskyi]|uniref:VOC domain-containing protein n=1 Tax=Algoriphagus winogradskyi TaxID=237017 RepID=A0ABY1NBT7_9BACT|nr:VOC family protein [Algoriphagus winogradskyi]SMP05776.1 hypothetical protein SAMN06265367_101381 [Algoriphagus winogradskyi]